ncbi:MAG TPA: substrate-binding domain-containing protein [Steroidobacteraceae bacterium]|nr:substrate-binding domain-containing protein [Steroidobacteraceae bacterium]
MRDTKDEFKVKQSLGLHLRYALEPGEQRGASLGNPLFDLLAAVLEGGSIRHAAQTLCCSYRYVWGSLRKWEERLGEPLIIWSQGQRARPTQFAERLLWSERRARTRMQPHIEALRSNLARVLADARDQRHQLLTVRASHDIALPVLQQHAADAADLHLDIRFQGSVDSLRALNDRQCLVAGFHVPLLRGAAPIFAKALKPLLKPGLHKLIGCSRRTQGLMVRSEHAAVARTFPEVVRRQLRFVNRQPGSGTRMLVDHLMHEYGIDPAALAGYEGPTEETHVAVAACIASGLADAGVGVEAAALQFGLHFVPLVEENYFLACLKPDLAHPGVERLRTVLAGHGWEMILANLPGYQPAFAPGKVLVMTAALPWWRFAKAKNRRAESAPASSEKIEVPI